MDSAIIDIITYTVDTDGIVQNTYGTGFYITDTLVVASANTMLASSFTPEQATAYYLQRVQKIIGINRHGQSFELTLLGMSPLLDVAVLIAVNPPTHTNLTWGDSTTLSRGQTIYSAYNMARRDPHAVVQGSLIDNSMTDSSDPLIPELLNVDIPYTPSMQGAPLLNCCQVVGVVGSTLYYTSQGNQIGTNTANGVVSHLLQPAVNDIINNTNVAHVSSSYGQWRQWILPSLEALYQYVTPYSLLSQLTSITTNTLSQPYPAHKIQGAMIVQMSSTSPLNRYLYPGDVIVSIDDIPIGTDNSITTALLASAGQTVTLGVRTKGTNYQGITTIPVATVPMTQTDVPYPFVSLSGNVGGSAETITGSISFNVGSGEPTITGFPSEGGDITVNSPNQVIISSAGAYEFSITLPDNPTIDLTIKGVPGNSLEINSLEISMPSGKVSPCYGTDYGCSYPSYLCYVSVTSSSMNFILSFGEEYIPPGSILTLEAYSSENITGSLSIGPPPTAG